MLEQFQKIGIVASIPSSNAMLSDLPSRTSRNSQIEEFVEISKIKKPIAFRSGYENRFDVNAHLCGFEHEELFFGTKCITERLRRNIGTLFGNLRSASVSQFELETYLVLLFESLFGHILNSWSGTFGRIYKMESRGLMGFYKLSFSDRSGRASEKSYTVFERTIFRFFHWEMTKNPYWKPSLCLVLIYDLLEPRDQHTMHPFRFVSTWAHFRQSKAICPESAVMVQCAELARVRGAL